MGETELPVGNRSSTSRLSNTAVQGKGKQYCTLPALYLTFWSPWGTTGHKPFPLLLLKHFPPTNALKEPRCHLYTENETVIHIFPPASEQRKTASHPCNSMDLRKELSLSSLVLSAAPRPGAGRQCQSRSVWGKEQGHCCRAPHCYHQPPDYKEEISW